MLSAVQYQEAEGGDLALARSGERFAHRQELLTVNALQRILAARMEELGFPLTQRGSRAELSRRSGVEDAIVSNIFNRPRYVPEEGVRAALAQALGIPPHTLDAAAAEIKGLRVYPAGAHGEVSRMLDDVRASFVMAADELTPAELDEIARKMDDLEQHLRTVRGERKDDPERGKRSRRGKGKS